MLAAPDGKQMRVPTAHLPGARGRRVNRFSHLHNPLKRTLAADGADICGWGFGFPIGIGTVNALHTPLNTRKAALFGSLKSKNFTRLQYICF
jgi:hypothetical protein